jgi:hypothetical protein
LTILWPILLCTYTLRLGDPRRDPYFFKITITTTTTIIRIIRIIVVVVVVVIIMTIRTTI